MSKIQRSRHSLSNSASSSTECARTITECASTTADKEAAPSSSACPNPQAEVSTVQEQPRLQAEPGQSHDRPIRESETQTRPTLTVTAAAKIAGVHKGTVTRWRQKNPELEAPGRKVYVDKLIEFMLERDRHEKAKRHATQKTDRTAARQHLGEDEADDQKRLLHDVVGGYLLQVKQAPRERIDAHVQKVLPGTSVQAVDRELARKETYRIVCNTAGNQVYEIFED
jgi:hypothetical protein